MGMFDTVIIECPNCRRRQDIQSKAGACILRNYYQSRVDSLIALALKGEKVSCPCGKNYIVKCSIPKHVSIYLEEE